MHTALRHISKIGSKHLHVDVLISNSDQHDRAFPTWLAQATTNNWLCKVSDEGITHKLFSLQIVATTEKTTSNHNIVNPDDLQEDTDISHPASFDVRVACAMCFNRCRSDAFVCLIRFG